MAKDLNGLDKHDGMDIKEKDMDAKSSIYGTIRPHLEKTNGEQIVVENGKEDKLNGNDMFVYKTMNGGVVRSVHPPGKGISATYKVSCVLLAVLLLNIF